MVDFLVHRNDHFILSGPPSDESIRVRQSKTTAGQRIVPMSSRCNAELLRWQGLFGPNFSEYVFPKPGRPETHLRDVRAAWANALSAAGLERFWIYDLRILSRAVSLKRAFRTSFWLR